MTVNRFRIVIYGDPAHKERPRFARASGRTYTPKRTVDAEARIKVACEHYMRVTATEQMTGPLSLTVIAFFKKPKKTSYKDFPEVKPDWDNIGKLVSDALNGIAYSDDAHIVDACVKKRWAPPGTKPCTVIIIDHVTEE